jgi:hypothetical protein
MIPRRPQTAVQNALARQAAVALTGPRQVGKTMLAHTLGPKRRPFTWTWKPAKIGANSPIRPLSSAVTRTVWCA